MNPPLRTWPSLVAFILVPLLALSTCAHSSPGSTSMDTNRWTTHCFGRFLVDLPPQARVRASYKLRGNAIERIPENPSALKARIDAREQDLRNQRHETEGSMFVRRVDHQNGATSLISWRRPYSTSSQEMDTYLVSGNRWDAFKYNGLIDSDRQEIAISNRSNLSNRIRSRQPTEIPTEPGFCIDGGYIAGREFMHESFDVGFTMPQHPGMQFSIGSSTGAEEDSLLDRIGGFFRTEVMGAAVGLNTLRKGQRPLGPLRGEEYAVAASDRGQRVYGFIWEFQGKDNSLSEPNINVGLNVLERDPGDDGSPPPPAFTSDAQALALWDAIIESIRLRPGAV